VLSVYHDPVPVQVILVPNMSSFRSRLGCGFGGAHLVVVRDVRHVVGLWESAGNVVVKRRRVVGHRRRSIVSVAPRLLANLPALQFVPVAAACIEAAKGPCLTEFPDFSHDAPYCIQCEEAPSRSGGIGIHGIVVAISGVRARHFRILQRPF
jgi:hypothetical protein